MNLFCQCEAYRVELDRELAECTDKELSDKLRDFDAVQAGLRKQLGEQEHVVRTAEGAASKAESALQACRSEAANLGGKLAALQEAAEKREAARRQMAKKWNYDASNAEAAGRVLKKMEGLVAKTREELAAGRKPLDAAAASAAGEVTVVQAERSNLSRTEAQTKQDIKSVEREIEAKRALGGTKASLEQQLEKARADLSAAQASLGDVKAVEAEVEELQKTKNATEKLLSGLSEQMMGASQIEAAAERLKMMRQQLAAKVRRENARKRAHFC